ncbi:MAG: hypothetical protein U0893_18410 [Chloroflexota bacterium]
MSTTAQDERELIFASFEDPAMGAVAEKALREWERQVASISLGNMAVVVRDAEGEVHVSQGGHLSVRRGALFGLIAGGLVGAAVVGLPLTVAIGTAAGIQAAAVAAGTLASATASASSTALAFEAALATGISTALSGGLGAAVGGAAGSLASLFGFKDDDLKQAGECLQHNHSAVVALITPNELSEVTDMLERLGATVRHGSVSQPLLDLAASQAPSDEEPETSGTPA